MATLLTKGGKLGYSFSVAGIPVTGFGSPNDRRTCRHLFFGGFFYVRSMVSLLLGGTMRGVERLAGACRRSSNLHSPALFAFGSARVENFHSMTGEMP